MCLSYLLIVVEPINKQSLQDPRPDQVDLRLNEEMADQRVSLQHFALDNFVGRRDVDHDIAHNIDQERLTVSAELDSGSVQEPPTVCEHDGFRHLGQHELYPALDLGRHQTVDVDVAFSAPVAPLVQYQSYDGRLVVSA